MGRTFVSSPILALYNGPGDVVGGALTWVGLRAYSRDIAGSTRAIIRLRRDSDSAEQDFFSTLTGGLDLAAISLFAGAAGLLIITLYDQIGSRNFISSGTPLPQFILNALGPNPVMRFTAANSQYLTQLSSGMPVTAQPVTYSGVAKKTGVTAANMGILRDSTTGAGIYTSDTVDKFLGYAGSLVTITASWGAYHAFSAVLNGASSLLQLDSVSSGSVSLGSLSVGGDQHISNGGFLDGDVLEGGIWPIAFNTTQLSSMSTNQRGYWGF